MKTTINYAINNNLKVKAKIKSTTKDYTEILKVSMCFMTIFVFSLINIFSYRELYLKSRNAYSLELQLEKLQKENSVLEGKKTDLINIKEIQLKAENLGFVYNNSINYLK